jgi:hypothetical protein
VVLAREDEIATGDYGLVVVEGLQRIGMTRKDAIRRGYSVVAEDPPLWSQAGEWAAGLDP